MPAPPSLKTYGSRLLISEAERRSPMSAHHLVDGHGSHGLSSSLVCIVSLRQPKVRQSYNIMGIDQDVLALQVVVHDMLGLEDTKRPRDRLQ